MTEDKTFDRLRRSSFERIRKDMRDPATPSYDEILRMHNWTDFEFCCEMVRRDHWTTSRSIVDGKLIEISRDQNNQLTYKTISI